MIALNVKLDDRDGGLFPELADLNVHPGQLSNFTHIGVLPHGMVSGKPSICIGVQLPDGKYVFAQTSLDALRAAMVAINARYCDA